MDINTLLDGFADKRNKLIEIYNGASKLMGDLELSDELAATSAEETELKRESFKVLVVGEFKRGKSTFINALLGEEVLPAFATPCTAVINEIKYSETKRAVLHFANPMPDALPEGISPDILDHINAHRAEAEIPPIEIPVDRIEEFVVIPDPGKDQAESVAQSPFGNVEIFWPIDLCKNNVEIIDSPGLNEHGTRTKVTTNYLSQADAVIFVLSCTAAASASELQAINHIIDCGHNEIFFACNRFDEVRERERASVSDYCEKRLADKTTLEKDGIHFISALSALDGKIEHDDAKIAASGFPEMEKDLVTFLVRDRGRIKLLRPASALKKRLNKIMRDAIPTQRRLLKDDYDKIAKRYEEAKPRLEEAERRKLSIHNNIAVGCKGLEDYVFRETVKFVQNQARDVGAWVKSFETKNHIKFLSLANTKKQCEKITEELLQYVESRLGDDKRSWVRDVLQPEVEIKMKSIHDSNTVGLEDFISTVDEVRVDMMSNDALVKRRDVPAWERIAAAGVGVLLVSEGSVIQASQDGFAGLAKSILPQLGTVLALGLLGLTNPWIFIPALFASGGLTAFLQNSKLEEKLKAEFARKVADSLNSSASRIASDVVSGLSKTLLKMASEIDRGMDAEIKSVRDDVEKILAIKKEGEAKSKERDEMLLRAESTAEKLVDELDDLIYPLK